MDKKEKKFTKIKVNNPDIMNETDESIIKHKITIALCVIAAAILLTVEAYMMINYKNQILFMIFLLIPFSVDVYVVVNSIINISLINRKIEREKYEDLYRAEKASYLILKKNFDKLSQKLFNIEQRAEIPADDLISIQKAVAKAQISRSKENAMALIDSNNKLVQQMGALESKLTNIHSEINENQSELLKKSNDEFLLRNKKLEEKLEDIYAALNNIKGLTESRNLNVVNVASDVDKDSDIKVDDNSNSSVESDTDNGESKNGDELVSSDYQDFNEVKIEENLINDIAFENLKRAEDKESDELSLKEDELSSGEETNETSQGEEGDELSPQSENLDDLGIEEEPEVKKDIAIDSENKNEGNKASIDVKEENSNEKKDKEFIDEKNSQEEKDKEVIDEKNSQDEKDKEVIGEDNFEKEEKEEKEKPVIPNLDSPDDPNHVLTPEEIEKLFSASNNAGDKERTNDIENKKANNAGDIAVANNNNDVEASKSIENSVVDETKEKDIVISNSAAENEEKRDYSGLTVENENETSNNAESEKNTTEGTENKIEKNVSVSEEKQNEDQDSQDNKEDDLSSTLGNIDSSDPNKVLSPDEIEKLFANL